MAKKKIQGYIYAYDPIIQRRVVHVVVDGWAISLVTGHKFKYRKGKKSVKRGRECQK